jgi:hypothetical protein
MVAQQKRGNTMLYVSEFQLAGKVIMVEERVSAKGNSFVRVGVQTGTRAGDRAWLNMSKEWAEGAEKGKQAVITVRFDAEAGRLRPVNQPTFSVTVAALATA